jgi:hydroxyacylglutathione hydrolase
MRGQVDKVSLLTSHACTTSRGDIVENNMEKSRLQIASFALGPAMTNSYLVSESVMHKAVVIDPAWNGDFILQEAANRELEITQIWLTHGHFDHFGGVAQIVNGSSQTIEVALHEADLPLWEAHGGASLFGFPAFDPGPKPSIILEDGMQLNLGDFTFKVFHTPGHSLGHVIYRLDQEKLVFCGDLIFMQSVGRTDLPGGSWEILLQSIQENILTLPDEYRLLPGHGPETSVGQERKSNPFLK